MVERIHIRYTNDPIHVQIVGRQDEEDRCKGLELEYKKKGLAQRRLN